VDSLEFLRVTYGEVSEEERQRVRRQLEEYCCGRDTGGGWCRAWGTERSQWQVDIAQARPEPASHSEVHMSPATNTSESPAESPPDFRITLG
jgi:hypothetical protein